MPSPDQIATVVANGLTYQYWQTIEVEREFGTPYDFARVALADIGTPGVGWSTQRLAPCNPAAAYLDGTLVINGTVTIRQVAYDANKHGVEITISSKTLNLNKSTVLCKPGQYRHFTLQQIGSAVAGTVGVGFTVLPAPGSDFPFARISESPGQTLFSFIEGLCRMRDMHLISDGQGTLIAQRGQGSGGTPLVEGQNIKSARLVMRDDNAVKQVETDGMTPGGSSTDRGGDGTRDVSATANNPNYNGQGILKVVAPYPGFVNEMQMHSNHVVAHTVTTQLTCEIVVYGWHLNDGSLWFFHLGEAFPIFSPMLFPDDGETLYLRRVVHRQSSEEGTTTLLEFCLPNGLSVAAQIQTGAGAQTPIPDPAMPG